MVTNHVFFTVSKVAQDDVMRTLAMPYGTTVKILSREVFDKAVEAAAQKRKEQLARHAAL